MINTILWWSMCASLATLGTIAVVVASDRIRTVVARQDREWQEIHWARQTAHASHPDTCPYHVIEWLSEPLVPPDQVRHLPLLSFQRCALACGHHPARTQETLLNRLQAGRRPAQTARA